MQQAYNEKKLNWEKQIYEHNLCSGIKQKYLLHIT